MESIVRAVIKSCYELISGHFVDLEIKVCMAHLNALASNEQNRDKNLFSG